MRRRSVVATAALIAALALAGLPVSAGSRTPSTAVALEPAAFTALTIPANASASNAPGGFDAAGSTAAQLDASGRSAGYLTDASGLVEPGSAPGGPTARPPVDQPSTSAGHSWKDPLYSISGYASFYDNGTTAMRLPRGTVIRICGAGGCIQRTVTDYGPVKQVRIVDMYRPDFFAICGCPSWSGTTWVTVSIY